MYHFPVKHRMTVMLCFSMEQASAWVSSCWGLYHALWQLLLLFKGNVVLDFPLCSICSPTLDVVISTPNAIQGHDDLCEAFFAYNRAKGTLYDGETRLFLRSSG